MTALIMLSSFKPDDAKSWSVVEYALTEFRLTLETFLPHDLSWKSK